MKVQLLLICILSAASAVSINRDQLKTAQQHVKENMVNTWNSGDHGVNDAETFSRTNLIELNAADVHLDTLNPDYWGPYVDDKNHSHPHDQRDETEDNAYDAKETKSKRLQRRAYIPTPPGLHTPRPKEPEAHQYTDEDYERESLLDTSRRRISPKEGLPANYFNVSEYRPYMPRDDGTWGELPRPETNEDNWRYKHHNAHCILGGIGKREIDWHPPLVRDFWETPVSRDVKTVKEWEKAYLPNFMNFWSKDPATSKWRSFTQYIAMDERYRDADLGERDRQVRRREEKQESCRRRCGSCYRAAQITGAEQFICTRREHRDSCQAGIVMGDPIGGNSICSFPGGHTAAYVEYDKYRKTHCGKTLYAQEGAPRNIYPTVRCQRVDPCEGKDCLLGNHTMLMATGRGCLLGPGHLNNHDYMKLYVLRIPLWGLLGHQSLAAAMQDQSIQVYYTDIATNPKAFQKALIIGTEFARLDWVSRSKDKDEKHLARKQMAPWKNWTEDQPIPEDWDEMHHFNGRYSRGVYRGSVGFGTIAGGTYLNASDPTERLHWRK